MVAAGFDAFRDYLVADRKDPASRRPLSSDAATDYRSRLRRVQALLGVPIEEASPLLLRAIAEGLRRDPRVAPVVPVKVIGDIAVALRAYTVFAEQQQADAIGAAAADCLDARALGSALRNVGFVPEPASTRQAKRMCCDGITVYVVSGKRTLVVIHPALERIYAAIAQIPDVIAARRLLFFHHPGLDGFPVRAETENTTRFGIPLGFASEQGLQDAIQLIRQTVRTPDLDGNPPDWDSALNDAPTTALALQHARRGQGRFRADLLDIWQGACPVTGVTHPDLLRASHIKAWRDSSDHERLDMFNGLLLSVHIDALFDRLLISFDTTGGLKLSKTLLPHERQVFGLTGELPKLPLSEAHFGYINNHLERFMKQEQRSA